MKKIENNKNISFWERKWKKTLQAEFEKRNALAEYIRNMSFEEWVDTFIIKFDTFEEYLEYNKKEREKQKERRIAFIKEFRKENPDKDIQEIFW